MIRLRDESYAEDLLAMREDKEPAYIAPETKWIPCSEGLPEDGRTVWVTIQGHDVIRVENGETLEQAIERVSKIRWVT